jgi:ribosome-associated heat shock protein Hsp15
MSELEALRIDKWLWAARFFKTRKLASDAVAGGKVQVDGNRCKPSREIRVGQKLLINKEQLQWEITIVALNEQRRPAAEAVLLYQESAESVTKRQQQMQQQREERQFLGYSAPTHKPNKKDRRLIHRFKGD